MSEAPAKARQESSDPIAPVRTSMRVLLVEDSPEDAELIVREIERGGYRVISERVDTREDLTAALERGPWDLVLSDFAMPRFSGPAALELVKSKGLDLPFIIVSGTVGEEVAVRAMRSGAHDYVLKQSLARLCPAVERELREARLRAERKKMQEQLLISERMVSVGTLAAGVAHELNNPLAALIANLDLLGRDLSRVASEHGVSERLGDVLAELRDARESAARMRHIVRDLKVFSRSPDDEHSGAVDVHRVMDSSLRMAQNEVRHRAQLVKQYAADVPLVQANEARLGQVFLNLVVNAAQAIAPGRAEHNQIRVCTRVNGAGMVVMEVGDTGDGIAPEHLTRIFDPFFTTKPVGVGTGLGLSICHRIIRSLGGELEVDSELGKGSLFRVLLPRATALQPELPEPERQPSVFGPTRRGRVLVVDDEPMIATAIGRTLGLDHDVVLASAAATALQRISQGEQFDVILCDLMMPQMTGMDLYEELVRAWPGQADRMVFLSGGAFTAAARAFLDDVPNRMLEKPFDTRQLLALVNERTRAH
jgi:signal transduction histidine kinase